MVATTHSAAVPPTPILVEKRFPLDLSQSITTIRDLYDSSKLARWDPTEDIPWSDLDFSGQSEEVRNAAALTWSRRAWVEYTGLPETPALLIRFCLEIGREADPKYFLSVRNTEEAWHVEVCHRIGEAAGGYVDAPTSDAYAALFNQAFSKQALGADTFLDGYVAAHCALEDGLELELWRGYLENATDPVIKRALELCVEDKKRHAAFGWFYVEKRAADWSDADRAAVGRCVGPSSANGRIQRIPLRMDGVRRSRGRHRCCRSDYRRSRVGGAHAGCRGQYRRGLPGAGARQVCRSWCRCAGRFRAHRIGSHGRSEFRRQASKCVGPVRRFATRGVSRSETEYVGAPTGVPNCAWHLGVRSWLRRNRSASSI